MTGDVHHMLGRPRFQIPVHVALVVAPYYKAIADDLIIGAQTEIDAAHAKASIIEVPGALEVPTAIRIAHQHADFDGFVALGCIIRGETTHYDTVCTESARAIQSLGLDGACIGNGILTVETHDQAVVRADPNGQNKGGAAAAAALHLIALTQRFSAPKQQIGFQSLVTPPKSTRGDIE